MPIFLHQSRHTLLDIDTFFPSFLFTLVNNNTSIVNTPFFSRRLLTYNDKVAMNVRIFLVVKGHMFVSGAGQNSSLTLDI